MGNPCYGISGQRQTPMYSVASSGPWLWTFATLKSVFHFLFLYLFIYSFFYQFFLVLHFSGTQEPYQIAVPICSC